MPMLHALLVGINAYRHGTPPLSGCVPDALALRDFLQARAGDGEVPPRIVTLLDADATRSRIIQELEALGERAGPDDVALFYFSGHGVQEPTAAEFRAVEPSGMNEALVCWSDDPADANFVLADKELAGLLYDISNRSDGGGCPHVVVIFDCCHSGSGARGDGVREVKALRTARPLAAYHLSDAQHAALLAGGTSTEEDGSGWFRFLGSRHLLLAACRADELAKERYFREEGRSRGVFTYHLLRLLTETGAAHGSYRDLFQQLRARTLNAATAQTPQLEASDPALLDRQVLGGGILPYTPYFPVRWDEEGHRAWVVEAGAVHGLIPPSDDANEATIFALFPFDPMLAVEATPSGAVGHATVREVHATTSVVQVTLHEGEPDPSHPYRAFLVAQPLHPLGVHLQGDATALAPVRAALATLPAGVREVGAAGADPPDLLLRAGEAHYTLHRAEDESRAGFLSETALDAQGAQRMAHNVGTIARFRHIAALRNPHATLGNPVQLSITVRDARGERTLPFPQLAADGLQVVYTSPSDQDMPTFSFSLTNTSHTETFTALLLVLDEVYAIGSLIKDGNRLHIELPPGASATFPRPGLDDELTLWLNDALHEAGIESVQNTFKLIVTTGEADAAPLEQDGLDLPLPAATPRAAGPLSPLTRLMERIGGRAVGAPEGATLDEWTVFDLPVTIHRPLHPQ